MPELTEADYDALFSVMKDDMPRMWREIFPAMLAHFEGTGALTITVTNTEVVVRIAKPPQTIAPMLGAPTKRPARGGPP